ncbi:hypothetical protein [Sporosarcina koreensis]|uniref:hypothetical protein n=1 Tax=Sporosarcina koreensis TaxID=334735 RepID=UPI000759DEF5|nr:hypothetical protein [Sporosarcina koreensis]
MIQGINHDLQREAAKMHLKQASQNLLGVAKNNKDKQLIVDTSERWMDIFTKNETVENDLYCKTSNLYYKYERYDFPVTFDPRKYEFIISWDITLLDSLLKKNKKEKESIPNKYVVIDKESLNKNKDFIKIENPIMVVNPCILTYYGHLLINGTHRVYEYQKQNIEFSEGYIIKDNLHLDAMLSEIMKDFYLLGEDLMTLGKHIQKPVYQKVMRKSLKLNIDNY